MRAMDTQPNWEAAGAAEPEAGRRTIRQRLEAAGLALDTPAYNRAVVEFRRGQAAAMAARRAAVEERERSRIAPFLSEARENVMAWGCVEAEPQSPEAIEQMIREEATRLADEADAKALEEVNRAQREAAELEDYCRRQEAIGAAVQAAEGAAAAAGWRLEQRSCSHDCSRYYWLLRDGDEGEHDHVVSLRISDHHAKNGAGWNESRQTLHDEPDVNIVLRRGAGGEYTFDLTPLMETVSC